MSHGSFCSSQHCLTYTTCPSKVNRSVANPRSAFRWNLINEIQDFEDLLLTKNLATRETLTAFSETVSEISDNCDSLSEEMNQLSIAKYECNECGAQYKVPWTLKSHIMKKHNNSKIDESEHETGSRVIDQQTEHQTLSNIFICDFCQEVFFEEDNLIQHYGTHLSCHLCKRICPNMKQLKRHISTHK